MFEIYKNLANEIHINFNVNLSLCKIYGQRWSFIYEAGTFNYGNNRIKFDDNYGIIIQCNRKILMDIEKYISESNII